MKKYLLLVVMSVLVLVGCSKNAVNKIDINAITDLVTLQNVTTQLAHGMRAGSIEIDKAQVLVEQLQRKYLELTGIVYPAIEDQFASIQKVFDAKAIVLYTLPLWAKKLGMTYPTGMSLDKSLSKQSLMGATGYYSTLLVYTGMYTVAMKQAKLIADKAHLFVSKNFWKAQALANIGNIKYISGLDIGGLIKGIIYVNHELLETNIDNFLSVAVDQYGVLILEATKYKN